MCHNSWFFESTFCMSPVSVMHDSGLLLMELISPKGMFFSLVLLEHSTLVISSISVIFNKYDSSLLLMELIFQSLIQWNLYHGILSCICSG